jgi:signal transduction histidine kinase
MKAAAPEAAARGVRLTLSVDAGAPRALADARALSTVLLGLLHHALAHSPADGTVEIAIAPAGTDVVLEVRDEGESVAPEDLARMLRPFEHMENVLVRATEGAGFGLAIVNLLCRGMDGRLSLRSADGEGLTSILRLPAVRAPEAIQRGGPA